MSLKRNIIANYIGQVYGISVGIIVTPLYLQYLGAEPYGLVGIFALMQAWMGLLDMGVSPTLGRQTAVMRGQGNSIAKFWTLLKSFEAIFMALAVLIVTSIYISSPWLAHHWINVQNLQLYTVIKCFQIMGILIASRWFVALYRSGINGLEDQVWLNIFNVSIISVKFLGALLLVSTISNEILHFFIYQLAIAFLEVILLARRFYYQIDKPMKSSYTGFDWAVVKSVLPYAMGMAYTSAIWILTTQTDKLIFSKILPLADFGYFTLISLLTGGIIFISSPINEALIPRMTYLYVKGENESMIVLYRNSSQIAVLVSLCLASMMGLYAEPLLYAWTNDKTAAAWGADVLLWFALGNAVMLIGAYPYYMQKAMGKLKWHVIGSTFMVVLHLPIIYWAATTYGVIGAGKAWLIFLCAWFIIWTPFLHRQLIPGLHLKWIIEDILPVFITVTIVVWLQSVLFDIPFSSSRPFILLQLLIVGILTLTLSSISTRLVQTALIRRWKRVNVRA